MVWEACLTGRVPLCPQVVEALKRVDRILGILMDGLIQRGLLHCANVIVVSDHGELAATHKSTNLNKGSERFFRSEESWWMFLLLGGHRYGGGFV